jgi:DNA polymerase III subunit epsilon
MEAAANQPRPWWQGRLCAFDTETTGPEPTRDRLVSAAVVRVGGGLPAEVRTWLARPEVPIPEQATAVHGITDAHARERGRPAIEVLVEVAGALRSAWDSGLPVIAYNAPFDLTLLAAELARHGLPAMAIGPLIDPLVLDRQFDRWRRGSRRLDAVCRLYAARLDDHHRADADALAAARLAYRMGEAFPAVGVMGIAELHVAQGQWRAEQDARWDAWRRQKEAAAAAA